MIVNDDLFICGEAVCCFVGDCFGAFSNSNLKLVTGFKHFIALDLSSRSSIMLPIAAVVVFASLGVHNIKANTTFGA